MDLRKAAAICICQFAIADPTRISGASFAGGESSGAARATVDRAGEVFLFRIMGVPRSGPNEKSHGLVLMKTRLETSNTGLIEQAIDTNLVFPAVVHFGAPLAGGIDFT